MAFEGQLSRLGTERKFTAESAENAEDAFGLAERSSSLRIGDDYVVGIATDELGVERVQVHRIRR